jgi:2',3'-cyclic-nucleotide 2'-phosphodiesterase (5'-nucleotidase family)
MEPAVSSRGASSIEAMNRMGYQAAALGEKDLSVALSYLRQRVSEAKFPILSANVVAKETGQPVCDPYAIKDVQGHRVGIIGLTGQPVANMTSPYTVNEPLAALRAILPEVAGKSDFVIVLTSASAALRREIAKSLPDVDLVISAGDEWINPPEVGAAGGLIVQAHQSTSGHAGLRLGILRLALDSANKRSQHAFDGLPLGPEVPDQPEIAAWVATQPQ